VLGIAYERRVPRPQEPEWVNKGKHRIDRDSAQSDIIVASISNRRRWSETAATVECAIVYVALYSFILDHCSDP
jgi:hypothetical protein